MTDMEYMDIRDLILINQYVQGIVTKDSINEWFLNFQEADKRVIVRTIWQLAVQARVNDNDVILGMNKANLKPTNVPVVISQSGNLPLKNRDTSRLGGIVLEQAFWLVLECLSLADRRRKVSENPIYCNHWWHKDLSDKEIVEAIKNNKL